MVRNNKRNNKCDIQHRFPPIAGYRQKSGAVLSSLDNAGTIGLTGSGKSEEESDIWNRQRGHNKRNNK